MFSKIGDFKEPVTDRSEPAKTGVGYPASVRCA